MLPRVSRTFALCIRFLPPDLRQPVLLSYLLCRVADTIEDSRHLPAAEKRVFLNDLARSLAEPAPSLQNLQAAFAGKAGAEAQLVASADRVLAVFAELPADLRAVVIPWVQEMCQGMGEFTADRDGPEARASDRLRTLATVHDLERYCYFVAGTVGHLLTGLFGYQRLRVDPQRVARLDALAESFGTGLQLTNIIVDSGLDQDRGVSYVPEDLCRREGIRVDDLLAPTHRGRARAVMAHLISKARVHLADALTYCELLPRGEYQIRLFCLVPVFLALRTLRAAEAAADFPSGGRVKIGRAAVYRTVTAARLCASSNTLVRVYAQHLDFSA